MGGDHAPGEIIAGAKLAAEAGHNVLLVGTEEAVADSALPYLVATEVIAMDDEPGTSVRTKKDSSLVRAAEAVRDGKACAMVSAGNTGATMAAALLRMKRVKGVQRPAIATMLPKPSGGIPNMLVDAGANADCTPALLQQFARMGVVYHRARNGIDAPRVGLLSIGEESSKGNALVKETFPLLDEPGWQQQLGCSFIGNVEGRDVLGNDVDVVVTDGFTGNVTLKTLEGAASAIVESLLMAFDSSDEARQGAELLVPALTPLYKRFDPETIGGAALLGVNGICIISHGSSSAKAIVSAVDIAANLVDQDAVGLIEAAVAL